MNPVIFFALSHSILSHRHFILYMIVNPTVGLAFIFNILSRGSSKASVTDRSPRWYQAVHEKMENENESEKKTEKTRGKKKEG